jgi:hypothetical protein
MADFTLHDETTAPDAARPHLQSAKKRMGFVTTFTKAMVTSRGWVDADETSTFIEAGHSGRNILDVILGVGMKTLSNYTNHLAHTPVDPAWQGQQWSRGEATAVR